MTMQWTMQWIETRHPAKCDDCGRAIPTGERAAVLNRPPFPQGGCEIYCKDRDCGERMIREQSESMEDECSKTITAATRPRQWTLKDSIVIRDSRSAANTVFIEQDSHTIAIHRDDIRALIEILEKFEPK